MAACWKKDGEEERRDANLERTWVTKGNEGWFGGSWGEATAGKIARTGGCLELDFRKGLRDLKRDLRRPWHRFAGLADIQGAARNKPPPCQNLRLELESDSRN